MKTGFRIVLAGFLGLLTAIVGHTLGHVEIGLMAGVCVAVVALPFRVTHPHRANEHPSGYVSWYQAPHGPTAYLRHHPAGNVFQEYYSEGYEYVYDLDRASVFENEADAVAVTPTYDGNTHIRADVMAVFGRKPTRTHLDCCRTCREGGDCSAHQTFPPEEVTSAYVKDLLHNRCPIDGERSIVLSEDPREIGVLKAKCTFCRSRWVVTYGKARHAHDYANYKVDRVE